MNYEHLLEQELERIAEQNLADGYDEASAWDISGFEMLQILTDLGCPDDEAREIILNMGREIE